MRLGFWDRLERLQRLAVVLAVLSLTMLVLLMGRPSFTNASRPPRFGSPVLSIQFVRGVDELDLILGDQPSPDREVMRLKTYIDFAFIACYVPLLTVLGLLLMRQGGWKHAAGIAAGMFAAGAGVFDLLENRAILNVLDVPLRFTMPAMLNAIRGASLAKWSLAAATVILLCTYFIPRTHESAT
jgi:hypothetical protein